MTRKVIGPFEKRTPGPLRLPVFLILFPIKCYKTPHFYNTLEMQVTGSDGHSRILKTCRIIGEHFLYKQLQNTAL